MKPNQVLIRENVGWSLLVNVWVEVRYYGRVIRAGFVEDVMPDYSALWIAADGNDPRQMIEACPGLEVWVTHQDWPPASATG